VQVTENLLIPRSGKQKKVWKLETIAKVLIRTAATAAKDGGDPQPSHHLTHTGGKQGSHSVCGKSGRHGPPKEEHFADKTSHGRTEDKRAMLPCPM